MFVMRELSFSYLYFQLAISLQSNYCAVSELLPLQPQFLVVEGVELWQSSKQISSNDFFKLLERLNCVRLKRSSEIVKSFNWHVYRDMILTVKNVTAVALFLYTRCPCSYSKIEVSGTREKGLGTTLK